jgi:hypothetical protein
MNEMSLNRTPITKYFKKNQKDYTINKNIQLNHKLL